MRGVRAFAQVVDRPWHKGSRQVVAGNDGLNKTGTAGCLRALFEAFISVSPTDYKHVHVGLAGVLVAFYLRRQPRAMD